MIGLATKTLYLYPNQILSCSNNGSSNVGDQKQQQPTIAKFFKTSKWANQVPKILNDALWLRPLEDAHAPPFQIPTWPRPSYPGLSGMDLLTADLEALAAYGSYFYWMSRIWSRPLPEVYDAELVTNYFNCRPHIIALRLLEVFIAFSSAVIKIRTSRIKSFIHSGTDEDRTSNLSKYDFGKVLKETMLNLGPTFIKVGQSLSTRPDIIGSEISKALSELHDQIPPFPRAIAMKIIEDELGAPVERLFSYVSDESVAAASFGQVYKGTTFEGCAVAIKVQRPNLLHLVARDIYILRLGLGLLRKIAKRKNDIRLYADELGRGLMGELDYRLEAANASRFLEVHSSFSFIRVPKIYPELTRKRVLTMEWMVGENPNELMLASTEAKECASYSHIQKVEAKQRLLDLVTKGVEASLVQLLETGFLHADPHPGNLRYTATGQIGFLDFGLMCQMERKHQLAMLAAIIHIVNGDWASLVQALCEMDVIPSGTNTRLVTMELENSLGEVQFNDGMPDIKFSKVLGKILSVTLKYQFRMPPYFTFLLRSLASLEGLAIAADENFKTFEAAYPYVVRKLLTDNSSASRRILHSVILNRRREFQWQRLAVFLRVGATRKQILVASSTKVLESPGDGLTRSTCRTDDIFDVTTFVLNLLPSKDGMVLRRLLMTADGKSLMSAFLSREASGVRERLCRVIADVLYQWLSVVMTKNPLFTPRSQTSEANSTYQLLLKDRRLKVVLRKMINDARQDWWLMLRLSLTSFVMLVKASAIACHRLIVSLSEASLKQVSFASIQVIVST